MPKCGNPNIPLLVLFMVGRRVLEERLVDTAQGNVDSMHYICYIADIQY
jgi:hypothetical protein